MSSSTLSPVLIFSPLLLLLKPDFPPTGTYKVAYLKPGQTKASEPPAGTFPGAIPHVVVEGDRWMLFDMMVGFDGTIKVSGRVVTFITENNPSGKVKKPDRMVFDSSSDGRRLTLRPKGPKDVRLVLTWESSKLLVKPHR